MSLRDRVVELKKMSVAELSDNADNFRLHPQAQKNAFRGIVEELGIAGALVAYYSERNGGKLTLIDGHMRKNDFPGEWPVLITDLNDDEADKLLQAYDPVAAMALADKQMLARLRERGEFQDSSVRVMLDSMPGVEEKKIKGEYVAPEIPDERKLIPEMELQPYEHYDYVMVLARSTMDWNYLCDRLEIKRVDGSNDARVAKIGLGRACPADRLIRILRSFEVQSERARMAVQKCPSLTPEQRKWLLDAIAGKIDVGMTVEDSVEAK